MFLPVVVGALGDSNGFADGLDGVSLREQFTNVLLQFVADKRSPSAFFHGVSKTANLLPSCSRPSIASAVTTQRRKHSHSTLGRMR